MSTDEQIQTKKATAVQNTPDFGFCEVIEKELQ
jgi:hypothetical protein